MQALHANGRSKRGFSLTEMVITIAVIGIMSAIAVPAVHNIQLGTKRGVSENLTQELNNATKKYGYAVSELRFSPVAASAADELAILRTLQYRDPGNPTFGSPYMRDDWNPVSSNSDEDFRLIWQGTTWAFLEPGTAGTGLKIDFTGADVGTKFVFPPGFLPLQSR